MRPTAHASTSHFGVQSVVLHGDGDGAAQVDHAAPWRQRQGCPDRPDARCCHDPPGVGRLDQNRAKALRRDERDSSAAPETTRRCRVADGRRALRMAPDGFTRPGPGRTRPESPTDRFPFRFPARSQARARHPSIPKLDAGVVRSPTPPGGSRVRSIVRQQQWECCEMTVRLRFLHRRIGREEREEIAQQVAILRALRTVNCLTGAPSRRRKR